MVALDYRWAEDLNLSDEQQDALWSQIAARRAQLTAQPTFTTEPVASYPAEETNLPYDVVVEKLHIEPPEPPEQEAPAPPARNFHISDNHLGEGGPKQKFARNVEAIRTLQTLENENRNATPEEQEILSRYVGWGGLADAFDPDKDSWAKEYAQLKELLTPEEYAAARASTLNAHYTSPTVIHAIYDAVEKMGFQTGNILEPSCGVGNFFGMLPESMQGSRLYGVELDSISGRIAQKLYPEANITVAGFETTKQQDFYDLAVGNVPFGNYKVNDKDYNKLGFSIHNYFFAPAGTRWIPRIPLPANTWPRGPTCWGPSDCPTMRSGPTPAPMWCPTSSSCKNVIGPSTENPTGCSWARPRAASPSTSILWTIPRWSWEN